MSGSELVRPASPSLSRAENKAENEQSIWENGLLSMADTVAANLTKMFRFKNAKIMFDYSALYLIVFREFDYF